MEAATLRFSKKDFRLEIAGQARNDSKGAASDLEVAQQQAKRRLLRLPRQRSFKRSDKWRLLRNDSLKDFRLALRTGKAAFGSFATVATPV